MNVLVFDIETIPDAGTGRRLYGVQDGLDDNEVVKIMQQKRREETDGNSDFLRHYLHRIVAISAVLRQGNTLQVWSLGDTNASEQEIIGRFFDGIEKFTPTLVSWNGGQFDLPVLHYRALLHGVNAARYWESGDDDRDFRFNNYLSRYHARHTDLMDVLAGYNARAYTKLDDMAVFLGFPGKLGISGDKVWDYYRKGDIETIRQYCETDVLNTYIIYLRWQLTRGQLSEIELTAEHQSICDLLQAGDKPHFKRFLEAWISKPT